MLSGFIEYGPILITKYRVAVLVTTVGLLVGLWAFLVYTPFGRIVRAGSRDAEMVGLLGINLPRVLTGVFGLGCALAGAAGLLGRSAVDDHPSMGAGAIMPAFVIVTIGGLGSYVGAIIGGLAVGIVTALTIQFMPSASAAAMYVLMAVVLLVRPRGCGGTLGAVRMRREVRGHPILWLGVSLRLLSVVAWLMGTPLGIVTQIAIYVLYGAGVNFLVGYTGLVPFGASVFFGCASYAVALGELARTGRQRDPPALAFRCCVLDAPRLCPWEPSS